MKIILPAHEIPSGTSVTKATGSKTYTLLSTLPIFGDKTGTEITLSPDVLVLQTKDSTNLICKSQELAVHFDTVRDMWDFLDNILMETA